MADAVNETLRVGEFVDVATGATILGGEVSAQQRRHAAVEFKDVTFVDVGGKVRCGHEGFADAGGGVREGALATPASVVVKPVGIVNAGGQRFGAGFFLDRMITVVTDDLLAVNVEPTAVIGVVVKRINASHRREKRPNASSDVVGRAIVKIKILKRGGVSISHRRHADQQVGSGTQGGYAAALLIDHVPVSGVEHIGSEYTFTEMSGHIDVAILIHHDRVGAVDGGAGVVAQGHQPQQAGG